MSTLDNKSEGLLCTSCQCLMLKPTLCKALYHIKYHDLGSIRCSQIVCPLCQYCTHCSDMIFAAQQSLKKCKNNPNSMGTKENREFEIDRQTKILRNQYRV